MTSFGKMFESDCVQYEIAGGKATEAADANNLRTRALTQYGKSKNLLCFPFVAVVALVCTCTHARTSSSNCKLRKLHLPSLAAALLVPTNTPCGDSSYNCTAAAAKPR